MEADFYLFMLVALGVLALTDLIVGVSNDAVNFLNSALGSKAVTFKTLMVVASIGIAFGALSSSGMMEVARKGIFNPSEFVFAEIMIIFMAVMLTDVLLLDFFNTLGMPTSTTVSIVFELLGAAVAVALLKEYNNEASIAAWGNYINGETAATIMLGIFLSVGIAFAVGAVVQFLSRLWLSFKFEEQPKAMSALFGGVAITAILYFILIKGLQGTDLFSTTFLDFVAVQPGFFLLLNLIVWTAVCWIVTGVFKQEIYRIVIVLGTFALATAFAGNDLVNFIGVPLAALQAFQDWQASGIPAAQYTMEGLAVAVSTPTYLLLASGGVMIVTLWFSTKARHVAQTEINLARQAEGEERFTPNFLSRYLVALFTKAFAYLSLSLPSSVKQKIAQRLTKPKQALPHIKAQTLPAFDRVRACVNLMVASVLIAMATSLKLPLSTTYVTFMVAMGTALADRAWGANTAAQRVAGVLNVIGGWFFTALCAFTAAAILAYLLHVGGALALGFLLLFTGVLLTNNYVRYKRKNGAPQKI